MQKNNCLNEVVVFVVSLAILTNIIINIGFYSKCLELLNNINKESVDVINKNTNFKIVGRVTYVDNNGLIKNETIELNPKDFNDDVSDLEMLKYNSLTIINNNDTVSFKFHKEFINE